MTALRRGVRLVGVGFLVLGLAALAPERAGPVGETGPQRPLPQLTFTVSNTQLQGTRTVAAGHVVLNVENNGSQPHQVALWLVPPNRNRQQAIDSMRATGRPPQNLVPYGGIGPLPAGQKGSILMRLAPGQYIVYCTLNGTDGDTWFKHGVLTTLDVTGEPNGELPYELPMSFIQMTDQRIQFGQTIPRGNRRVPNEGIRRKSWVVRGRQSIQIESFAGPNHALVLLKSDDPSEMARYAAWLEGRGHNPGSLVTGVPAVPSGQRSFLRVNLAPGGYILFCPNRHQRVAGMRGYQTGEFTQFSVK